MSIIEKLDEAYRLLYSIEINEWDVNEPKEKSDIRSLINDSCDNIKQARRIMKKVCDDAIKDYEK